MLNFNNMKKNNSKSAALAVSTKKVRKSVKELTDFLTWLQD